jgi:hypothetical protein
MVWKVAMNLSRPLVASEGNLDPIDGYVVFRLLQASASKYGEGPVLDDEIADYKKVMERKGKQYVSRDPLDLGMRLWMAHWFAEREKWATDMMDTCVAHLRITHLVSIVSRVDGFPKSGGRKMLTLMLSTGELLNENRYLENDLQFRLAFRDFGTCLGIGMHLRYSRRCCWPEQPFWGDYHSMAGVSLILLGPWGSETDH